MMVRLSVNHLGKRYGTHWVLRGLSFELSTGNTLHISGANGAGKSTLCQLILGFIAPTEGSISLYHSDNQPNAITPKDIAFAAPYMSLPPHLNVQEMIELQLLSKEKKHALIHSLSALKIPLSDKRPIQVRSSGTKQRLLLALALHQNRSILLLDEADSFLDQNGRKWLKNELNGLKEKKILILASNQAPWMDFDKRLHLGE